MTPLSDGLAEPDARIDFHAFDDRLINTMILETISITMYSSTNLLIFRGNNGRAQFRTGGLPVRQYGCSLSALSQSRLAAGVAEEALRHQRLSRQPRSKVRGSLQQSLPSILHQRRVFGCLKPIWLSLLSRYLPLNLSGITTVRRGRPC